MTHPATFQVYNASAGSGKTYTLVKEYLTILLGSNSLYTFQNILAITFTNKAAAEMKERVLENLHSFSSAEKNAMFSDICRETGMEAAALQAKSRNILENILQNYSAFNITTIDSFTHKLIRTFAFDLDLPLNFELELEGVRLLKEAVDVVISKIGMDQKLTDVLIDFTLQKVSEDKSWDISKELNKIAKILLDENAQEQLQKLESKSLEDFKKLHTHLAIRRKEIAALFVKKGTKGLELIDQIGVKHSDFSYGDLPKFFQRLVSFASQKTENIKFEGRLHKLMSDETFYTAKTSPAAKAAIDAVATEFLALYQDIADLFEEHHGTYVLMELVSKSLIPLAVLSHIQKELSLLKKENNICLNAEFNQMIANKIKNEPAPFIYERIGEKFRHYFIDEMQDTSSLQWQNLIPLIENSLSQEHGSLLLVGDAKQAIYRWRGGEAEQFIALTAANNPFQTPKETRNLETNYRSFSEVIEFNNSFFSHIANFLTDPVYRDLYSIGNQQQTNHRKGGFVQVSFIDKSELEAAEREEAYPKKVLELLNGLDGSFKKNEVCVLVRKKKEGVAIANYLSAHGIEIISSETLLLQNSQKVRFLIDILSYIQNPMNKEAKFGLLSFLHRFLNITKEAHLFYKEHLELEGDKFYKHLEAYGVYFERAQFLQMSFYDSVEQLIRSFQLLKKTDAYVQFFLDFVLDFQRKNYNDLSAFLELWEQKKDQLSITASEGSDAVRIMTVHKSKGLEFPVVIFPCDLEVTSEIDPTVWYEDLDTNDFDDLQTSLVSCSSKIKHTGAKGKELFEKRQQQLTLDNFNLLYVALTRAVEQLYIVSEFKFDSKGEEKLQRYSGMYVNFLKSLSGPNQWDPQKRSYDFGVKSSLLSIEKQVEMDPVAVQETYVSSVWKNHEIVLVSNASKNWGTQREKAVNYGLLVHEMLSKITIAKDIPNVLTSYVSEGLLSKQEARDLSKILYAVADHPELSPYFQGDKTVFTEREILTKDEKILIPDRLVFDGQEVVVIDYKTGSYLEKHTFQIKSYAALLTEMGFCVSQQFLVYLGEEIKVVSLPCPL
jgi:ATP-dependent exoDNAse (exonuclease V) beta subunit